MFINKYAQCADIVVERDFGLKVQVGKDQEKAQSEKAFFNLATHMQAHARTCYDFDAVLINVASQFACFFSVYDCKILMHMYINMYN